MAFEPQPEASKQLEPTALDRLIEARLSRRGALRGMAVAAIGMAAGRAGAAPRQGKPLDFAEVSHGRDEQMHFPPGYQAQVLVRWGDPLFNDSPAFEPTQQTPAGQLRQFGYNNDFVAFLPLPRGSNASDHGLLCVNHEYTIPYLMFADYADRAGALASPTRERADVEQAAHGQSIVEIRLTEDGWQPVVGGKYNRRISTLETPMRLAGPVAGHARVRTSADPKGVEAIGTLNNCSGGVTPWGTMLSGEENFHYYFAADVAQAPEAERRSYKRYGLGPNAQYPWHEFHARFDPAREPHEPNRFGWVVEIDPYNPESTPVKHTALGRMKHEGATPVVSADGRVAVYLGDDERHEYLYRYVSRGKYDPKNLRANRDLLDDGVLSVAVFNEDGTLRWAPLVYGQGPLTEQNGFRSQADVLLETRVAADLLGATSMDRPEDIEVHPTTGHVFVMLTNNTARTEPNAVNTRVNNRYGQVLELIPPEQGEGFDHTVDEMKWDILLLGGNPANASDGARYHHELTADGWLSSPDNCAIDPHGRLWIGTDGLESSGLADGLFVCHATGPQRAWTRHFFRAPRGAEVTGPCFTPDGTTLFIAIQHPADESGSTFTTPSTRWPDFDEKLPPRPSVVAIRREDGGAVGG